MLTTAASIEQELNSITNVAYKCYADHCDLMTSPLITAPPDGSHSSLVTDTAVAAVFCGLLRQPEQYLSTPHLSIDMASSQFSILTSMQWLVAEAVQRRMSALERTSSVCCKQ